MLQILEALARCGVCTQLQLSHCKDFDQDAQQLLLKHVSRMCELQCLILDSFRFQPRDWNLDSVAIQSLVPLCRMTGLHLSTLGLV